MSKPLVIESDLRSDFIANSDGMLMAERFFNFMSAIFHLLYLNINAKISGVSMNYLKIIFISIS